MSCSDGVTLSVSMTLNFLNQPTSVTDAAGTRNFTYNTANQLASETIPAIVNGVLAYTYDTAGRRTAMSAGNGTSTFANATYTYDTMGRIATVGNSTDTLTYTYVPGTGMIASSSWQTATVNTAYTYDSYKRLTNIAVNNTSVYGYTLNDKNQRIGATLPDGRTWSYSYDYFKTFADRSLYQTVPVAPSRAQRIQAIAFPFPRGIFTLNVTVFHSEEPTMTRPGQAVFSPGMRSMALKVAPVQCFCSSFRFTSWNFILTEKRMVSPSGNSTQAPNVPPGSILIHLESPSVTIPGFQSFPEESGEIVSFSML